MFFHCAARGPCNLVLASGSFLPRWRLLTTVMLVPLLATCAASTNPLSDPVNGKDGSLLAGVWQQEGERFYYHVRPARGKLPKSVFILAGTSREPNGEIEKTKGQLLGYSTTIGSRRYLNMAIVSGEERLRALEQQGWDRSRVDGYLIFKYTLENDILRIWPIDVTAMMRAVRAGRIKGLVGEDTKGTSKSDAEATVEVLGNVLGNLVQVAITDTSEDLRRLIASEPELFSTKEATLRRLK